MLRTHSIMACLISFFTKLRHFFRRVLLRSVGIAALLCVLAIIIFTSLVFFKPHSTPLKVKEQVWRVAAIRAQKGSYQPTVVLYGKVESPRETRLESAVSATVDKVSVRDGQMVKRGQLLLALDPREAQWALTQREAEVKDLTAQLKLEKNRFESDKKSLEHEKELVKLAEIQVGRHQQLVNKKVGSQADLDNSRRDLQQQQLAFVTRQKAVSDHEARLIQLEAQLARALAMRDRAQLDLDRTQVKAPYDGRITKLNVATGNRVQQGEVLIELYDINDIELRVPVPIRYVNSVRQSLRDSQLMQAQALIDQQPVTLRLERLAGKVSQGRSGVDALMRVVQGGKDLELGRTVEIILKLSSLKDVYAVPASAVYRTDTVYIVDGQQRLHNIKIEKVGSITSANGQHQEIIRSKAIKPGDLIVTTYLANARNGMKVEVNDYKSTSGLKAKPDVTQ